MLSARSVAIPTAERNSSRFDTGDIDEPADHEFASIAIVPEEILRSVAIAGSEMEQRHVEAQLCVLPTQRISFLISAARVLSCMAEPERGHK
jgi:hypothetical protein